MKKIALISLVAIIKMFANNPEQDFENDDEFFKQQINNKNSQNEYFNDDPAVKKNNNFVINQPKEPLKPKEPEISEEDDRSSNSQHNEKFISLKNGMETVFYSDGKLKSEINYRDGRKDGIEKLFYSDGKLKSEIEYRNGQIIRTIFKQ